MRNIEAVRPPEIGEIESRLGARDAIKRLFSFLQTLTRNEVTFRKEVNSELAFLYGEAAYSPGALANGGQAIVTVTATNAILGYEVSAAYDKDLQGLVMGTPYVSATDTVKIVLFNNTGGPITLAAGKFRVYVRPRVLSS